MTTADIAVMILLMCSRAGTDCMEIQSERSYQTTTACREDLASVLRRMNHGDRKVIGRCALLDDLGVDPIVTGSTEQQPPGTATVKVTRIIDGAVTTQEYFVPRGR